MGEVTVEDRGRVLIPKKLRDKIGIKGGEKMRIREKNGEIVLKPLRSSKDIKDLKGTVKKSKIDPLDIKEIWKE